MKPGDKVEIFRDPITKTQREEIATLVSLYREDTGDGLEMWEVRFDGDEHDHLSLRTIQK